MSGSDDNKDRGIEFRYHDGSNAKLGFFGLTMIMVDSPLFQMLQILLKCSVVILVMLNLNMYVATGGLHQTMLQ